MALLKTRAGLLAVLLAFMGAACASEEWDNPYDPDAKSYRAPCADAPASDKADCVLWEEFDHGLGRWQTDASGVTIAKRDPGGKVQTVLSLACGASARIEVDQPTAKLVLDAEWQGEGTLEIRLNGRDAAGVESPAETAGWTESFADLTGTPGSTSLLELRAAKSDECSGAGVYVSRLSLRKAAD